MYCSKVYCGEMYRSDDVLHEVRWLVVVACCRRTQSSGGVQYLCFEGFGYERGRRRGRGGGGFKQVLSSCVLWLWSLALG